MQTIQRLDFFGKWTALKRPYLFSSLLPLVVKPRGELTYLLSSLIPSPRFDEGSYVARRREGVNLNARLRVSNLTPTQLRCHQHPPH